MNSTFLSMRRIGSKERIRGMDIFGLLCGMAGLGLAILIATWARP
jgi:hypothetical protein